MNINTPCRVECGRGGAFLEGKYSVFLRKQEVGTVQVMKEGLYYRFICHCRIQGDVVCRLGVICGNVSTHIGVPVPEGTGLVLDKRIPVKKFGRGNLFFFLVPQHESSQEEFVPITPEEPFAYIERLKDAFLVEQRGRKGIYIQTGER